MREITEDRLQIAYEGPAIVNGRMPMTALAAGLRGQALLAERVGQLLYGDSVSLRVDVDEKFEQESLIAPFHVLAEGLHSAEDLLVGRAATAAANLIALLGFFGVSGLSLYALFKRLKGRPITNASDVPPRLELNISVEILVRIYNDKEVQKNLRYSLEPLRYSGIDEIQTRRNGEIMTRINKADLLAADAAEIQDLTSDSEEDLAIEKVAWRRDLAWHFSDGETRFDAKIEDDSFWEQIAAGEPFSIGDRMRVHLHTTAQRTDRGKLKVTRQILRVIEIDHVRRRQGQLFQGNPPL